MALHLFGLLGHIHHSAVVHLGAWEPEALPTMHLQLKTNKEVWEIGWNFANSDHSHKHHVEEKPIFISVRRARNLVDVEENKKKMNSSLLSDCRRSEAR